VDLLQQTPWPVLSNGVDVKHAAQLAERFVAPLGRRWRPVQAVALRAAELAVAVAEPDRKTLVAAAWLHDIGYATAISRTQFHPLDGAQYLREEGWPATIVNLVAHHSAARFEATERGLSEQLASFPFELSPLQDALDTADLTTGPDRQRLTYDERINEILHRYPPTDPVHRFWLVARPVESGAIERTEQRLISRQPR
jgi:putative nucleotidyltransferase with HDIG domain